MIYINFRNKTLETSVCLSNNIQRIILFKILIFVVLEDGREKIGLNVKFDQGIFLIACFKTEKRRGKILISVFALFYQLL